MSVNFFAILLFVIGLKEFINAIILYSNKRKKESILSLILSIFVCICAILSFTNLIWKVYILLQPTK